MYTCIKNTRVSIVFETMNSLSDASSTSEPKKYGSYPISSPMNIYSNSTVKNSPNSPPGEIITVSATMFGGKSVYALHVMESRSKAYRRLYGDQRVVAYINHSLDTRDGAEIPFSTHSDIISSEALDKIGVSYMRASKLSDVDDDFISRHKVIFIDEAQFFPDLVERVLYIAETLGIDVYAMGLTTDYKRQIFGHLGYLSLIADESITLRTTFCGFCADRGIMKKAIHTHRINDTSKSQVEIGSENYVAVCRKCYIQHSTESL